MENVTFEFKGYTVIFKPSLNFGQKRQMQKLMASKMSVDVKDLSADTNVDGAIIYEVQDLTLKSLLVSFKTPEGKVFEGTLAYDAIQELDDDEVGRAIYAEIDKVTSATKLTPDSKKK